jgi:hypothetical protein
MRILAMTVAAGLLAAALPAAEPAPAVPKMTREAAEKYVAERDLALTGSNLVGPIMNGDAETVEALLSAGLDVNDTSDLPKPVMRLAMQPCAAKAPVESILTVIEVLLAHGAKVDEPPGAVLTPLVVAAQNCPAPIVKRLLKAGAEIDYKTAQGYSALSMALLLGNYGAAEALVDAGAKLSAEAAAKLLENKKDDAKLAELVKRARSK